MNRKKWLSKTYPLFIFVVNDLIEYSIRTKNSKCNSDLLSTKNLSLSATQRLDNLIQDGPNSCQTSSKFNVILFRLSH